jgi:hypothetical protein
MQLRTQLQELLFGSALEQELEGCLAAWTNATSAEVGETRSWIQSQCHDFIELAGEIDDSEELELSIAVRYIELKSHWMMLNTKIQYSLFHAGEAPEVIMFRASLVSHVVGALEQLLTPTDIERITRFLAQPISRGAA